jgi:hypothetical protein
MIKIVLAALSAFSIQAFANDGGIAVVDVLGVAPAAPLNTEITVYGNQLEKFYNVLPVTFVYPEQYKSLYFASPKYAASVFCKQEYERPTTGETRTDYMCTFKAETREDAGVDNEDNNPFPVEASSFTAFSGSSNLSVLGVAPGIASGNVFSFYGGQAKYLAQRIPSALKFSSGKYRVTLACQKNYKRPTTGELRSDYMCTLSVKPK